MADGPYREPAKGAAAPGTPPGPLSQPASLLLQACALFSSVAVLIGVAGVWKGYQNIAAGWFGISGLTNRESFPLTFLLFPAVPFTSIALGLAWILFRLVPSRRLTPIPIWLVLAALGVAALALLSFLALGFAWVSVGPEHWTGG